MSGFTLFFQGADVPGWRKMLAEQGAAGVGLSFRHLAERLPKTKVWKVADNFPEGQAVLLDPAIHGAEIDLDDLQALADKYVDFVEINVDRLDIISEFDALPLGLDWIEGMRRDFFDKLPVDKFMPVWHKDHGLQALEALGERYDRIAVVGAEMSENTQLRGRLNSIHQKYSVDLHGVSIASPDVLLNTRYSTASTSSWLSAMRFGETIVWDGSRLKRYPMHMKEAARKRHRSLFTRAGFDADAIAKDEPNEVARFTIWSWRQFEEHVAKRRGVRHLEVVQGSDVATTWAEESEETIVEDDRSAVAASHPAGRNLPAVREQRAILPVFETTRIQAPSEAGEPVKTVDVLSLRSSSMRKCDTCYVATNCPAFIENSACAYDIPVEVKTKDQLLALLTGMIEMQSQRVLFARFNEELEGGYPDPNLSNEMDRLFKLVERMKDIQDNREFMKMTVETRGGAGVLSRLFGEEAAGPTRLVDSPADARRTNELMAEILDAEIVEPTPNS